MAYFDRDGHPDYVLQNFNTNRTVIWYLNNNVLTGGALWSDSTQRVALGGQCGDFNGDGKPDYLLYTQVGSNFPTAIWYMNNNVHVASASGPTLPNGWALRGVADFNGDGKPDFLLYKLFGVLGDDSNNRTAIWYLKQQCFYRRLALARLFRPAGTWWTWLILIATATRTMCFRTSTRIEQ